MPRRSPDAITRDRLSFAADQEIDRLTAPFARAVVASVKRHTAGKPLDYVARVRILADTDAALDGVYGKFSGDKSAPLYRLVVRQARAMRAAVFAGAMRRVRRLLQGNADLLRAVEAAE